jgi:hypothetical protein
MRQGRCRYANPATRCQCKGCDGSQHGEVIAIRNFVHMLPLSLSETGEAALASVIIGFLNEDRNAPVWIEDNGRKLTAADAVEIGRELERAWQEHLRAEVAA